MANTLDLPGVHTVPMARKPKQWRRTFIREWRIARNNMTQAVLADAMGITEGYLSSLESGNQRYNQDILEKAAAALKVPVSWLLTRKPPVSGSESEADLADPDVAAAIIGELPEDERRRLGLYIKSLKDFTTN